MRPVITVASGLPLWVRGHLRRELGRRVCLAGRRLGLGTSEIATITVHLVNDRTIAQLNLAHMGKRGATDVLSFPGSAPVCIGANGPVPLLGDIVLSWPAITRQALGASGPAYLDEATVLTLHGLAHLLGHDHRHRRGGRAMHLIELRALAAAGVADIARPYGLRPISV